MDPIQRAAVEAVKGSIGDLPVGKNAYCAVDAGQVLVIADLVPDDKHDGYTRNLVRGAEGALKGARGSVTVHMPADDLRQLLEKAGAAAPKGNGDVPKGEPDAPPQ